MVRNKVNISDLFQSEKTKGKPYLNVAAPMVRYSKLEFRTLLRKYGADLCFTPMIIADSFSRSETARNNEFSTNEGDTPLIAQFAANNTRELLIASELISPFVDGVDINCGCPQSWAIAKGYGCGLLKQPELIKDMIQTLRRNLPSDFSCSVKLRLLQKDPKYTVEVCRALEHCGASFLTIHGRTPWQKTSDPVDVDSLAEVKKSMGIPLIVNGNVRTVADAEALHEATNCDGVMAARGLLSNPSLFSGTTNTSRECLQDWVNLAHEADDRITCQCFHHHLTFMLEKIMKRKSRVVFNNLSKKSDIFGFLDKEFDIRPQVTQMLGSNAVCLYDDRVVAKYEASKPEEKSSWNESSDGKFFSSYKEGADASDSDSGPELGFMGGTMFD